MKISNIGRRVDSKSTSKNCHLSEQVIVYDYQEKIRHRPHSSSVAKKLEDTDSELHSLLSSARISRKAHNKPSLLEQKVESDELRRIKKIQKLMEQENLGPIENEDQNYIYSRNDRNRELKTIEIFRERKKKQTIQDILRAEITTRHTINAYFGQGHYFEFVFTNPYGHDEIFEITWENKDIRFF